MISARASKLSGNTVALIVAVLLASTLRADDTGTALTDAAEINDVGAVRALLEHGASVNVTQVDGMTALHWLVYHDNEELTKRVIEAGADATATTRYGVSPLSIACMNGHRGIVRTLLEAGADPKTKLPGGESALMTAARTGRVGPVQELLSRGAEVDAKEYRGQTALMWAAAAGHVRVVDELLEAGADLSTALASGFTPLFFAVREGRTEVVLQLIEAGLDIDAPMKRQGKPRTNPLLLAVENAHYATALALLNAGADPDAQPRGHGALHAISWVRKPIRGDGNPPPVGSRNVSDLTFVRAMVERGANVNLRLARGRSGFADFTTTGSTPFVLAARTGDLPLMRTLLDLGADPTITNADGASALLAAAGIGDLGSGQEAAGSEAEAIEAARLLLKLGADVNLVDENGETAVHGATYQNWPKLIQFLADNGADVSIWNNRNRWGWTPHLIAHGYRKGNFRPDVATIETIERLMRAAGVTPPPPGRNVVSNQQGWDRAKPRVPDKKTYNAAKKKAEAAKKRADLKTTDSPAPTNE